MMFTIGIAVALSSLTITVAEDNKQKLAAQSEKYANEIETLKMILKSRLDKLNPPRPPHTQASISGPHHLQTPHHYPAQDHQAVPGVTGCIETSSRPLLDFGIEGGAHECNGDVTSIDDSARVAQCLVQSGRF
jgi:hypothetical protein